MMSSYSSSANVKDKRVGVPFLNQIHASQPSLTSQEADDDSSKVHTRALLVLSSVCHHGGTRL
jgi:hypothetical protein